MRKLAAVLLLAIAAQCQTMNIQQVASSSKVVPTGATVASGDGFTKTIPNAGMVAQMSDSLAVGPISQAVGGSVAAGGRPIIKAAVIKPARVSTVNQDPARNSRIWYSLVVFDHSAAAFDAYSTRQAIGHGGVELNPFLKPFADSAAIYPALQVWPTAMDLVGAKMMHSNNRVLRRVWWVPQAASTVAFVSFGFHNLGVHAQ
jgi:hypothetical protein